jgi:crotonobetainyl-CoA:carnitine CoA-transferase CaiB-like acyl-CoA transferase
MLGQQTSDVLAALGLASDEIERLRAAKVIG